MVNTNLFFFELNEGENEVFDEWELKYFLDIDDQITNKVFDEYKLTYFLDIDDQIINQVFDPEFQVDTYILTEGGEILMTEQGDNLVWN